MPDIPEYSDDEFVSKVEAAMINPNQTDPVTVEQRHRDAAANVLFDIGQTVQSINVRNGCLDGSAVIQAFVEFEAELKRQPAASVEPGHLLPCPIPWCERKDREIVEYPDYKWSDRYYRVECGCGAKTPRYMTESEAIAAWNTRQPAASDDVREAVARAIARANGDEFANAFKNKARWIAKRGMSGGRFRDINEPMQSDYLAMADAALTAQPQPSDDVRELRAKIARIDEQVSHGLMGDWNIALTNIRAIVREAIGIHRDEANAQENGQ